jgi:predicted RNA methylase
MSIDRGGLLTQTIVMQTNDEIETASMYALAARCTLLRFLAALGTVLMLVGCAEESRRVQVTDTTQAPIPRYEYPTAAEGSTIPYVTTPEAIVDSMLELAGVTQDDVVYDLGSGDGRIPIRAATKYGARGVGIEIRADLVDDARQHAAAAGVASQVEFRQGDLFEADISDATVVTLYLLPAANVALRPKLLRELEAGARVVSHDFHMEEWRPDRTKDINGKKLHLWRIPEELPKFVEEQQ